MSLVARATRPTLNGRDRVSVSQNEVPGRWSGLALLVVALYMSQTTTVLGMQMGFPSQSYVTVAVSLFSLAYVIRNHNSAVPLFIRHGTFHGLGVLFFFPISMMFLQLFFGIVSVSDVAFWAVRVSSLAMIFVGVVVFAYSEGVPGVRKLLLLVFALLWLGYFTQLVDFDLVRSQLVFRGKEFSEFYVQNRAIGFFGHPNRFAFATVMTTSILVFILLLEQRFWRALFATQFGVLLILLSGSRTSLALISLALILCWFRYLTEIRSYDIILQRIAYFFGASIIFLVSVTLLIQFSGSVENASLTLAIERFSRFFQAIAGGGVDQSAEIRSQNLAWFTTALSQAPILGQGPDATAKAIRYGIVSNVSQNSWIQWVYEYGIFYPAYIFVSGIGLMGVHRWSRGKIERIMSARSLARILVILLFVATFSLNNLFVIDTTTIGLGLVMGLLIREAGQSSASVDSNEHAIQ